MIIRLFCTVLLLLAMAFSGIAHADLEKDYYLVLG